MSLTPLYPNPKLAKIRDMEINNRIMSVWCVAAAIKYQRANGMIKNRNGILKVR
jgi:hypothetical protein